jgi:hypothetical protein
MFISPTAMLDTVITPDLLYSVGVMLKPEQETALIGKLKLVLGRRIAKAVWFLLSAEERHDAALLSDYASRDAVQRWLGEHCPNLSDIVRVEALLLKSELLMKARAIQVSGGERGIPDWVEYSEAEAA